MLLIPMRCPRLTCMLLLVWGSLVAGCAKEDSRPAAEISGTVTFNGTPMEEGSVTITSPKTGETAATNIAAGGAYTIQLVAADLGEEYQVSLGPTIVNEPGTHAAEMKPEPPLKTRLPKRYLSRSTSGLTVKIEQPGNNPFDIALTSP